MTDLIEAARQERGCLLVEARKLWPSSRAMMGGARGPNGTTWRDWLKSQGLTESTAYRYMKAAGWAPIAILPRAARAARRTTPRSQCVYFIQGSGGGPIKIGSSNDVEARLRDLQTGSPVQLRIVGTSPGGPERERGLHRELAAYRLHGEWFTDAPEVLAAIAEALQ